MRLTTPNFGDVSTPN